jgi:hypothetical protein
VSAESAATASSSSSTAAATETIALDSATKNAFLETHGTNIFNDVVYFFSSLTIFLF